MEQFGPGRPNSSMRPIDHAFLYLGVQEQGGPNRGKMIDSWLRRCRLEPDPAKNPDAPKGGYPWCSSFASCMVEDAGWEIEKSASGHRLWQLNRAIEVVDWSLRTLEEGDVLIHLRPNGTSHVALFRYGKDGRAHSIDGNSNKEGSREGIEVALCDRTVDYWTKVLRPRTPR